MPSQIQFRSDDTSRWDEKFGNGSDGTLTVGVNTTDTPVNTVFSGTSGAKTGTVSSASGFAVNDLVVIHQSRNGTAGAGTWQLNKITNISGVTFTLKYDLVATFDTTAQIHKIYQYDTVNITANIASASWDGSEGGIYPIFCSGTTTISGNVTANGSQGAGPATSTSATTGGGFRGGASNSPGTSPGYCGEGSGGATASQNNANGNGGGGGTTSGAGGGGGNGTVGTAGGGFGTGGVGGSTSGSADLTSMTFGGAGGGGNGDSSWQKASGGSSGGIIMLFSKDLVVTGGVTATGGAGGNGGTSGDGRASGGGGAGGSILIKCQTATLGTNLVTAAGGAGGSSDQRPGGAGGVGRIHIDYLTSYTGSTSPTIDARQDPSLTLSGSSMGAAAGILLMI